MKAGIVTGIVVLLAGLALTAVDVWLDLAPAVYWINGAICGEGAMLLSTRIAQALGERTCR